MSLSFPLPRSGKPGALPVLLGIVVVAILAGCGGSGPARQTETRTVKGVGFRFEAPVSWKVTHARGSAAASSGKVDRVEVMSFRLVRPYQPRRFGVAVRELDSVIARIAEQLKGHVVSRRTVRVDGRRSRSYVIAYDSKSQQITFVLKGRQEHQLLCRRTAAGSDDACRLLLRSFALRG
jgi:hypothetical protein